MSGRLADIYSDLAKAADEADGVMPEAPREPGPAAALASVAIERFRADQGFRGSDYQDAPGKQFQKRRSTRNRRSAG